MSERYAVDREQLDQERWEALRQVVDLLEGPMMVLGFVWLAIVVAQLTGRSGPLLSDLGTVIWIVFLLDFAAEFILAPHKGEYLKAHWLVALSLALPALRVLRFISVLRVARVARLTRLAAGSSRGVRLLSLVSSFNRGMQALRASMARRGFGYVVLLTIIVVAAGSAGMLAFEGPGSGARGGLNGYGQALWWTAMIMTTMGSDYWPQTAAGRILCLLLALYAFAVFGYVTATLATFFVGRDAESGEGEVAGEQSLRAIAGDIQAIRAELEDLRRQLDGRTSSPEE